MERLNVKDFSSSKTFRLRSESLCVICTNGNSNVWVIILSIKDVFTNISSQIGNNRILRKWKKFNWHSLISFLHPIVLWKGRYSRIKMFVCLSGHQACQLSDLLRYGLFFNKEKTSFTYLFYFNMDLKTWKTKLHIDSHWYESSIWYSWRC